MPYIMSRAQEAVHAKSRFITQHAQRQTGETTKISAWLCIGTTVSIRGRTLVLLGKDLPASRPWGMILTFGPRSIERMTQSRDRLAFAK